MCADDDDLLLFRLPIEVRGGSPGMRLPESTTGWEERRSWVSWWRRHCDFLGAATVEAQPGRGWRGSGGLGIPPGNSRRPQPQKMKHLLHRLMKKALIHSRQTIEIWKCYQTPDGSKTVTSGSLGRTRTCNLVVNSHPLCRLSYQGTRYGRPENIVRDLFPVKRKDSGSREVVAPGSLPGAGPPPAGAAWATPSASRRRIRRGSRRPGRIRAA